MIICANCGVELEDGLKVCPLCGQSTEINVKQEHASNSYPSDIIRLHRKENRKHLWELSGIIAFSGVAVCTIVDLLTSKSLKWSLFSDASVLTAWMILTLFLYASGRLGVLFPGLVITVSGALLAFDLISQGREWFLPVGLPLTIAAFFAAGTIIVLYRAANFKGFNIIAASLVVQAGLCIITEMILDNCLTGSVNLRWSLIAAISVFPVSLIFFFYHYRLKKGNQLDSFFHI